MKEISRETTLLLTNFGLYESNVIWKGFEELTNINKNSELYNRIINKFYNDEVYINSARNIFNITIDSMKFNMKIFFEFHFI